MATRPEEIRIRRVIACFAPGSAGAPGPVAQLARELDAELLGLFIEDEELLRFAAFPFAAEVCFPSAVRRAVDSAALERVLRAQAAALRELLAAELEAASVPWTFRVTRATPYSAIEAVLAEGLAPALLIPPGGRPGAERRILRQAEINPEALRALILAGRPVLILPE